MADQGRRHGRRRQHRAPVRGAGQRRSLQAARKGIDDRPLRQAVRTRWHRLQAVADGLGPWAVGSTARAPGSDHPLALYQRLHDARRSRAGAVVFAAGLGDRETRVRRRPRRSTSWLLRVRGSATADGGAAPQPIGAHHPA